MKKKKKKSKKIIKKKTDKKLKPSKKKVKKVKKIKSKFKSNHKRAKKDKPKSKKIKNIFKSNEPKKENFILKIVNFQNSLKPKINFNINFNFEKYIQAFFDKIANTIAQYKTVKKDETRRLKLERQEKEIEKMKKMPK